MIIQHSRGQQCAVRPEHLGSVHVSDLMRADIMREFGKSQPVQTEKKWWQIWN